MLSYLPGSSYLCPGALSFGFFRIASALEQALKKPAPKSLHCLKCQRLYLEQVQSLSHLPYFSQDLALFTPLDFAMGCLHCLVAVSKCLSTCWWLLLLSHPARRFAHHCCFLWTPQSPGRHPFGSWWALSLSEVLWSGLEVLLVYPWRCGFVVYRVLHIIFESTLMDLFQRTRDA